MAQLYIDGGLHIEMAILRCLGHWLENSGWTSALVKANVSTSGTADAVLKASHVTQCRYGHQVTAAALYILQKRAHDQYLHDLVSHDDDEDPLDFITWAVRMSEEHPQFGYWANTLELEMRVMENVRSLREGNCISSDSWFPGYLPSTNIIMLGGYRST